MLIKTQYVFIAALLLTGCAVSQSAASFTESINDSVVDKSETSVQLPFSADDLEAEEYEYCFDCDIVYTARRKGEYIYISLQKYTESGEFLCTSEIGVLRIDNDSYETLLNFDERVSVPYFYVDNNSIFYVLIHIPKENSVMNNTNLGEYEIHLYSKGNDSIVDKGYSLYGAGFIPNLYVHNEALYYLRGERTDNVMTYALKCIDSNTLHMKTVDSYSFSFDPHNMATYRSGAEPFIDMINEKITLVTHNNGCSTVHVYDVEENTCEAYLFEYDITHAYATKNHVIFEYADKKQNSIQTRIFNISSAEEKNFAPNHFLTYTAAENSIFFYNQLQRDGWNPLRVFFETEASFLVDYTVLSKFDDTYDSGINGLFYDEDSLMLLKWRVNERKLEIKIIKRKGETK